MSAEEETKKTQEETKTEEVPEEESTAHFKPVVQLEEVEVQTGEEEEEVLYTQRGKLFVFGETMLDKGTGNKSWKERGVGDVRFLKHTERQSIRLLMRQEKTLKVIANFQIDPRIELTPNVSSDRSWVWRAFDFSDGELVETMFALKFADSDIANEFKAAFEKYQEEMKDAVPGEEEEADQEADEAAEALAGLTTKDDDEPKTEES